MLARVLTLRSPYGFGLGLPSWDLAVRKLHVRGDSSRGRGLSMWVISRVIIGVTPFRVLISLLIIYLLSPLPLQVGCFYGELVCGVPFGLSEG